MNDLKKQVQLAQRRLLVQRFLSIVPWTLFGMFLLAAAAILLKKLIPLQVAGQTWTVSWIVGGAIGGLVLAGLMTLWHRSTLLNAAIEIDHRFGLKERVSSCLALDPQDLESEAGQALVQDAIRRVNHVDVGQEFRVRASRWALLPAGAAVLTFALTWLSDAQPDPTSTVQAATVQVEKRVLNSTENLKKQIVERQKKAIENGLEDAGDLFKKLEQGVDSLSKRENVNRQQALVKLNDLARDVQQRQQKLIDRDELRKQLNSLKDIKQGPADRMAKAMKEGDFKTALNEFKSLQDKLAQNELSEEEKKQLQQQLATMKDKMQQLAQTHNDAKQQLQRQIQQKLAEGDRKAAGEMQNKLDQLAQRDQQMAQLDKLAQKLGETSRALEAGQTQQAAETLGQLASELEGMQQELDEMQMLEEALEQIASAKDAMGCQSCNGMGCSDCQGDGFGMNGMGEGMNGMGMGEGQGRGDRPEEQTGTGFYDSQVRAKPGQGKAVATGIALGPNKSGQALEEIKAEIEAGRRSQDDPLTGQRLPKAQRELTREYFDSFRDGQ
jgi:chemotaxis protein histidine kinase CheA